MKTLLFKYGYKLTVMYEPLAASHAKYTITVVKVKIDLIAGEDLVNVFDHNTGMALIFDVGFKNFNHELRVNGYMLLDVVWCLVPFLFPIKLC
jgi:hypothetical protein